MLSYPQYRESNTPSQRGARGLLSLGAGETAELVEDVRVVRKANQGVYGARKIDPNSTSRA